MATYQVDISSIEYDLEVDGEICAPTDLEDSFSCEVVASCEDDAIDQALGLCSDAMGWCILGSAIDVTLMP